MRRPMTAYGRLLWFGLLLAALLSAALSGCSSVRSTPPAPIVTAEVLSADADDDASSTARYLPAPAALEPLPTLNLKPVPPPRPAPRRPRPVRRPPPAATAEATPPAAPEAPTAPAPLVNVRDVAAGLRGLLDAGVRRPNGNVVGRAVDAVVDRRVQPRDIVINLTGFMGIGDRKIRLPWQAVRFDASVPHAPIVLTSDVIAPSASAPSAAGSPAPAAGGLNLVDASVTSPAGTTLGRVIDLLLDRGGVPRAVVLDVSGALFHDKHLIAADWTTLHVVGQGGAMHLETDLSNQQIEASPAYEVGKPVPIVSPADAGSNGKTSDGPRPIAAAPVPR